MTCARCGGVRATRFRLEHADGPRLVCLRCAPQHGPLLRRSFRVAIVVGTVLTAINQGGTILAGAWTPALAWKIPLTYSVPFMVSMWGALSSLRQRPP